MATAKTKKTTTHKFFPKLRKYAAVLAAIVLIIALIGNKVNNNTKRKQEKANFAALEQTLTDFSAQVEQALGKPLQQETKSFCDRTGVKFGKGELFCGTRTGANYTTVSIEESQRLGRLLETEVIAKSGLSGLTLQAEIPLEGSWSKSFNLYANKGKVGCNLSLSFRDISGTGSQTYIGDSKPGTFGYLIRCTEYSSQQYYPNGQ